MKFLIIILSMCALSACELVDHQEKTSPCASIGTGDGPCERFPINTARSITLEQFT
jgi:hypothetical protein